MQRESSSGKNQGNEQGDGHRLVTIASTPFCRVDRCSCGTIHMRLRNVTMKLCPEEFLQVATTIGLAGEPYLVENAMRAN